MSPPIRIADSLAQIERAMRGDDRNMAINHAIHAFRRGVRHPLVLGLVAEGLEIQGRHAEALGLLQLVVAATPGDAQAWFRIGRALRSQDQRDAARDALERGLAIAPKDYRGLIDTGTACLRLGDLPAATGYFERASLTDPEAAEPLSALAVVAGLDGDVTRARTMAARALALSPELISAQIALARADMADGHPDLAATRMTDLLTRQDLADAQRIDAHDLRADGLDALDRPAEAFADYAARNAIVRRVSAPSLATASESQGDRARRFAAWFKAATLGPWRTAAGPDEVGARLTARHVFLVGFPRSGTTLLEKVLASHPSIVTLEEVDALGAAGAALLSDDTALNRLASLTAAQAQPVREAYWRGVGEALREPIDGRIFVDKMPLHTPALPLVAKLFPDARILFALRDPRDVVFSCFRRRFRMNAAMFEFLTLDGAAAYYDAVMGLAAIYREKLPLTIHEVRHETLVADFDGEARRILAFLGAPWDPAVKNFATQVRGTPRTPSAPQVARGLNADGVGQWRRYLAELAPVEAILSPWVERFGYELG